MILQGPSGYGEFAPFLEYDDETCARWLASAVEAAWGLWPAVLRSQVPVNAIVPAVAPDRAAQLARRAFLEDGCTTVKIKVAAQGEDLDDDLARIAAVAAQQRALGVPDPRIRIDVNGAWTPEEAIVAIPECDDVAGGLEYVEQPCAGIDELAFVRSRVDVAIAADESIRTAADPVAVVGRGAADIVVVKAAPLGGVERTLEVCAAAGVPVVVSGAMDSAVGLASGLAVAGALPVLPYACGLGTGALLAADLVAEPLVARNGVLDVGRIAPDAEALAVANSVSAASVRAGGVNV